MENSRVGESLKPLKPPLTLTKSSSTFLEVTEDVLATNDTSDLSSALEDELEDVLAGLISEDNRNGLSSCKSMNYEDMNIFTLSGKESVFNDYIKVEKDITEAQFKKKLKQFFILSTAGKPIYSMNGTDDVIMGYMGIITTIISTFEENLHEELQSITIGDSKLVFLVKSPITLVAISKISYESMGIESDEVLKRQLLTLYNYLLSILSKPLIEKNFHHRMNYDLRKILTPLDYKNLDSLCMKLTYGLNDSKPVDFRNDTRSFDFFISDLLNSSLQSIKISKTCRTKLDKILLSCKKLKDDEKYIGEELLFALLMSGNKLINYMRPKNHNLQNQDLKNLFSMIQNQEIENFNNSQQDLWFPLCMPHFNSNGFLYVFVKKFNLYDNGIPQEISIILLSGNKNAFYQMQHLSSFIIHKIVSNLQLKTKFYQELLNSQISIINDLKILNLKHFIYKSKENNQFVMSKFSNFNNDTSINSTLQLVYFYSNLYNNHANSMDMGNLTRKMSYMKWNDNGSLVTGFMLSDDNSEFYCVSNELVTSQQMIANSLKIIKWCEKYEQRLFLGPGVVF